MEPINYDDDDADNDFDDGDDDDFADDTNDDGMFSSSRWTPNMIGTLGDSKL